jgi:pimeloyl-ACP methyl ester carboxylesterase
MTITRGYSDTREGQLHYRRSGNAGGVPLVLLHQTASSSQSFESLMRLLADRFTVIAFDTPGFGQSFDPPAVPDIDYLNRALLDAMDYLGISQCHLFGHHTGACLGVEMAVRYPARLASLTLSGPLPMTVEQQNQYHSSISSAFLPELTGEYLLETWRFLASHGAARRLEVIHRELLDHVRAWRTRAMTYDLVWFQDFAGYLAQVPCPLLLMCSDDDLLWPFFSRAQEIRPDAQVVVMHGASNFAADYQPDLVAKALLTFIGSIRSG